MKSIFTALLAFFFCWPAMLPAAQQATVRLHCLSLIFQPATVSPLGINYTLNLGTAQGQVTELNGELAPLFGNGPTTHGCRFSLQSDILDEPIPGYFYVNVPPVQDLNSNNINDFFELSMPVSATTTGSFVDDYDGEEGTVKAVWNRSAGSPSGTCQLQLNSSYIQSTFIHSFSIWEYDGKLQYTPSSGSVTGLVSLADSLPASNTLSGVVVLHKIDNDDLTLVAGNWTNGASQAWPYLDTFSGETIARTDTNYFGFLDATNGEPASLASGFYTWIIYLGDDNDVNHNGIPDISDTSSTPVRGPVLSIIQTTGQLSLSIAGEIGQTYRLEQSDSLGQTNWTAVETLAITNNLQTYQLALPDKAARYWRLRSP